MTTQAQAEARALSRLAADELSSLPAGIGNVHGAISERVFAALGESGAAFQRAHDTISRGAYQGVRGALFVLSRATGAAFERRAGPRALSETAGGAAVIAAVNGLYGDRLLQEGNPLAQPLGVRVDGRPVEHFVAATPRLVVFLHGLAETEFAWRYGGGPSYGDRLAERLGVTPVYIRFNSGLHISENGAALAALLDELVAAADVREIALVGHSMGGLVARSACHVGGDWTQYLKHTISLGTPHLGAPLEQAVHALSAALHLAPETRPAARLLRRRSAGIRDLGHGSLVDEDWRGQDPDALRARARTEVPLHEGATHCFVSATVTRSERHPLGRLVGDTLVLPPSASGRGRTRRVGFEDHNGLQVGGTHHLALLNHPEVYAQLERWLSRTPRSSRPRPS